MKTKNQIILTLVALFTAASAQAGAEAVKNEYVVLLKPNTFFSLSANESMQAVEQLNEKTVLVRAESPEALASLKQSPAVEQVEPNYVYHALSSDLDWSLENTGQNNCNREPGKPGVDVKALDAWGITMGSESVAVAVIDTGVDIDNPSLHSQILRNEVEAKGQTGVDDDGNGYVDDIYGYDFSQNQGIAQDDNGHGTFCASQIVASRSVDPVAGLAPRVKILPVKFLSKEGSGSLANAVKAIDYAVSRGAKILSNSWGGGGRSEILASAIKSAQAKGVLFVAAAGNSGQNIDRNPMYPAGYDVSNIIAVTVVDNQGSFRNSWANYGQKVHLAAPGVHVYGLGLGGNVECYSGTSMATPLVAAAAALLKSVHPTLSPEAIKARLMETVTPLPELKGKTASGGMLNAFKALENL